MRMTGDRAVGRRGSGARQGYTRWAGTEGWTGQHSAQYFGHNPGKVHTNIPAGRGTEYPIFLS